MSRPTTASEFPKVFVSYAHDSEEHKADVLAFATLLRQAGVDADIDQWADVQRLDWSVWAPRSMILGSDYVVVIASPAYRVAGDNFTSSSHRGVEAEASVLRELLTADRTTWFPRILPVVLPGHIAEEIPQFLQPNAATRYCVPDMTAEGVEDIVRAITRQPRHMRPPLGPVLSLPPVSPWPAPAAESPGAPAPAVGPTWRDLVTPPQITWRAGLEARHHTARPALELHVVPVAGTTRLQMRRMTNLADDLVTLGRARKLFTNAESVQIGTTDEVVTATAESAGLAVLRSGQRSAWMALPPARIGSVLVPEETVAMVAEMLQAMAAIEVAAPDTLTPAIGIDPVSFVRIGRPEDRSSTMGMLPMSTRAQLYVPPEDSMTFDDLTTWCDDIAEELAARLLAAFRRAGR